MEHRRLLPVDLNLLVVLDALLEERSVGRAARRVGLSQPATSRALGRLRALLGDELLVRSGRAMLLTPRAQRLRPALRRQLHGVAALLEPDERFDAARAERTFTIAATDYAERTIVLPRLAKLRSLAPRTRIVVRPAVEAEIARADTGDVDVGIAPLRAEAPGLLRRRILSDPHVLFARDDHPALRGPLTVARYARLAAVQVSPDGGGTSLIDEALAGQRLARRIELRTPSFASALAAVRETDLVVTLPSGARSFADAVGLGVRPLPFLPKLELHLVRHERFAHDPAVTWLIDQLT